MLQTYKTFRPTAFDSSGLDCRDQQDWFVAPCTVNRDSDALQRSNWEVMVKSLKETDPDEADWEIHRFGHWANGWFEVVLLRPESAAHLDAESMAQALEDYPVLDEMHWSELEWDEAAEIWANFYSDTDRVDYLRSQGHCAETFADLIATARGNTLTAVDSPSELLY